MWGKGVLILALGVAGCAVPDPFERTEIGQTRVQVYQSLTVHDVLTEPDRDVSLAGQLGEAAFAMTRGLDRATAMDRLRADGAVCEGDTCRWTSVLREPLFPCGVPPVSLVSLCIREPGPRRTFEVVREVTFLAPKVRERSDVSTAIRQRGLE